MPRKTNRRSAILIWWLAESWVIADIPPPETQGPISLSFDLDITSELSYRAIDEARAELGFIATGDNDPETDCSHREFFFDVEVPYLPEGGD